MTVEKAVKEERNCRFDLASMVFCFMVVMIHSSYSAFYNTSEMVDDFLNNYYTDYLSGFAVPAFFMLSAIKFYRNYSYNKTIYKYKTRIKSLLVPYLLWNSLSVIWIALFSYMPILKNLVSQREKFTFSISNITGGVLLYKYIHPFWYMALLMLFTFLCPIVYSIIKNKICGICCATMLFLLDALPIHYPQTSWPMLPWRTVIYSSFFYVIGAIIGKYSFEKVCSVPKKNMILPAAISYIAAVIIRALTGNNDLFFIPSILLGVWGIWTLTGLIKIKRSSIITLSFFIYPAHTFVLPCVNKLLYFVLPHIGIMSIVNTVFGTIITYLICIFMGVALRKTLPSNVWKALNGGRT